MNCCNHDCREGRDCPARRPMLLISPSFWLGGLFSVGVWTGLAWWLLS